MFKCSHTFTLVFNLPFLQKHVSETQEGKKGLCLVAV